MTSHDSSLVTVGALPDLAAGLWQTSYVGRHSAPDDDGDLLVAPVAEAAPRPRPRPRHAAANTDLVHTDVIDPELVERVPDAAPRNVVDADVVEDDLHTEPVAPVAPVGPTQAPEAEAAPAAAPKREHGGRADLRLLRESSSLRARAIAGLVLPFILYTIVLVVISRLDVYLFWIWIPAILAGVLFGAQLDAAARRTTTTE
jgi:hypothetical protein